MKILSTTYSLIETGKFAHQALLTENNEVKNNYSIHSYGEPCSGIIKHWGTKEELIKELEAIIEALSKFNP